MVLLVLASQAWLSTQAQISGEAVMAISVSGGALLGAAASLLLCGAYTLASRFPPIYTQVASCFVLSECRSNSSSHD